MEFVMDARKLVLPVAALLGGAVLGRILTLRTLLRGAMAGFTLAQAAKQSGVLDAPPARRPRAKAVQRAARKRPAQKRSRAA
jgi:hypothetical protein